jgi:hypothetical protein
MGVVTLIYSTSWGRFFFCMCKWSKHAHPSSSAENVLVVYRIYRNGGYLFGNSPIRVLLSELSAGLYLLSSLSGLDE